jgi:putative endonuclease
MMMNNWSVYIVLCKDGTLYTGVTNNLDKRLEAHNKGKGAKYTKGRTPVVLVACLGQLTKSEAYKLEYSIKKLPKNDKVTSLIKMRLDNES